MDETRRILGKIVKRTTLPKSFWFSKNPTAQEVLIQYLSKPETFWYGVDRLQAVKVRSDVKAFMDIGMAHPQAIAELLLHQVQKCQHTHCCPFFVMGAGSSGSTWLGAMLGDLPGYCYGREIYVPPGMAYMYHKLKNQEMVHLVWAIMLLSSWRWQGPETDFAREFVNSARSIQHYPIYRRIWPQGRYIFLVRDPRDQLLSTVHRKQSYRQAVAPRSSDLAYLWWGIRKLRYTYRHFKKINQNEIHVVKYEHLQQDTINEMRKIANRFQVQVSEAIIGSIVYQHGAENMRRGLVPRRGNLDEGGVAKGWRDLLTKKEKRFMKPFIQETLEAFGYEQNSAW